MPLSNTFLGPLFLDRCISRPLGRFPSVLGVHPVSSRSPRGSLSYLLAHIRFMAKGCFESTLRGHSRRWPHRHIARPAGAPRSSPPFNVRWRRSTPATMEAGSADARGSGRDGHREADHGAAAIAGQIPPRARQCAPDRRCGGAHAETADISGAFPVRCDQRRGKRNSLSDGPVLARLRRPGTGAPLWCGCVMRRRARSSSGLTHKVAWASPIAGRAPAIHPGPRPGW